MHIIKIENHQVWLPPWGNIRNLTAKEITANTSMYQFSTPPKEYQLIGSVTAIFTLLDHEELIRCKVLSLEQQKEYIQAQANKEIVELDKQINSLLALENKTK